MSVAVLEKFLPENALPFLSEWFGKYPCHLKITRSRESKLGDYRKMPDKTHQITVNGTLEPQLFFFVLTHEIAHLIAFDQYGWRISPHGQEWKSTFRDMLLKSLSVYEKDLQPIIRKFSKSPKANFMASPDLVKYFHRENGSGEVFIEHLQKGDFFSYKSEDYIIEEALKKTYLCKNLKNSRKYHFKSVALVKRIDSHEQE